MTRTHLDTEAMHVPPADPPPLTPWGIVLDEGRHRLAGWLNALARKGHAND